MPTADDAKAKNHPTSMVNEWIIIQLACYICVQYMNEMGEMSYKVIEECHLKALRLLASNPDLSQRELARVLGISLGKTNYCVRALLDKGLLKMKNFRNSHNKLAYSYLLTPAGLAKKTELTKQFLKKKQLEYEVLKKEIEQLQREAANHPL